MPNPFDVIDDLETEEKTTTPTIANPFDEIEKNPFEAIREPILEPTLPNYLKFKLSADRAYSERSRYGREAMWGKMDTQEAISRGSEARDYWMTQAGPYEDLSFKKHPFKYVAGETVQLLPYMISSQVEGLKYGLTLGGGFAAITAVAGQAGPQALLPEEVITVPSAFAGGMATGYSYGVIKNILDREGGGLYLDMAEKGISPETARPLALAGGTLIGVIELMQFKLLGKPFKQAFSKVVKSNVGKKAITQAMGRYLKTVGGEMLEEELQEVTSLVTETIAGAIDEKPDTMPTREEWQARLLETAARAGAGLAVISIPGGVVDATTTFRQQKIIKKIEDVNLLNKIIAELKEQNVITSEESKILDTAIAKSTTGEALSIEEQQVLEKSRQIREKLKLPEVEKKPEVEIKPPEIKPKIVVPPVALPEEVAIKKGRLAQLETEIKSIDSQMSLLEEQKARLEKKGISIRAIDTKLEVLGTRYNYIDSQIAEILTGAPVLAKERISVRAEEFIKRVERGIKEGTIKTKEQIATLQTEAINFIEQIELEPKDKAKLLKTIKNIQTQEQLQRAMPKIIEIKEKAERVELVGDLKDLFRRQPTKNLPLEYKDLIEDIKSKFLLKQLTEKAKARLESMRQFVERMAEEGEEINIPEEKLALLDKTSVDEMTTQELRDLKEVIARLYHQGKLKNKLLTALQERKFDDIKTEIINLVTQGKGLNEDSSIIRALREQNKNLKDKSLDAIKNYIIENMRPELMLNILDGGAPGLITNILFGSLWESQKAEFQEGQKVSDTIKDIHKNLNFAEIFTKKYDIGRFKGMTKDNALFIYANSFNDSNLAHLIGSGVTDEDITAITNFLSIEEKLAVRDMIRLYDEYQYPVLDRIFSELEGVHLGREEQYFPIDRLEDISYNKELEKDILERNYVRRPGVSKGFTKERVSSKKGFSEFSYFGTIMRNYRKVEHYKAFAKSIRDANKILNNPEIRASIKEKLGDKYHQVLDKWLKDVAYGSDKQSMDFSEKAMQWLRTNYVVAVIGGNLVSVMKAPVSFLQGMEMAGKWNTVKASFKFMLAPLDWNEKIADKSVLMKFRAMRQERELGEIVSQRTLKGQIDKVTGYQLIREKSMLPWVIADKATCNIIWLAAYEGALSDNMTEQQAVNHADMVIRRTQPMSGALNLPQTFRGREYQKLLTLFRNQPNQNFNLLLESILQKQKGKIGAGEFSSHLVFHLIVPAVMIGVISRKRLPEEWGEFARDMLNGAFGGLLLVGNITSMIAMGFRGTTTPIDSLIEDFYNFYQSKDAWKKLDNFVDMVSKLAGIPYTAIKRIVTGKPLGEPAKTKKKGLEPI